MTMNGMEPPVPSNIDGVAKEVCIRRRHRREQESAVGGAFCAKGNSLSCACGSSGGAAG
jgi:hypothetical protein